MRKILLGLWILCLLAGIFSALKMLLAIITNPSRAWLQAISFDQLANASIGGDPDETISSRAYRKHTEKWTWRWLKTVLDWIESDHCKKAYESEKERRHLPPELRGEEYQ